jgi:acetyltransferase-like isoleucine patch superfamily enzyme
VVPEKYRTIINEPIVFKDFATLGVNCSVLPGITLGEGTIVGANSVVTQDTEPWMVYAGTPARPIKKRDHKRIMESIKELGY